MNLDQKELMSAVKKLEISTKKTVDTLTGGAYHSVFKGRGMEFSEVREYCDGDDVRAIDWNVTARTGHPYVKQFTEERELNIFLLVDISASADFGSSKTRMQASIEMAMLIAFSAMRNKDRVGMILHSDQDELHLKAKRGKQHILRLARELIVHQRKGKKTNIKAMLESLMKVQKKKSIVFLISDLMDEDYQTALKSVANKHDLIVINILDKLEIDLPQNFPPVLLEDFETSLVEQFSVHNNDAIDRNKSICTEAGADFLVYDTSSSPSKNLMKFFGQRKRSK